MGPSRTALAAAAAIAVWGLAISGGSRAEPRTPPALPGEPPPFLGTAVIGSGGLTAAIDAYGDVVDLRAPGPAGRALIDNPAARQSAGSVPADTGVVPRVSLDGGPPLPLWRADAVSQRYLAGANVLRTVARFGALRIAVVYAAVGDRLACLTRPRGTIALRRGALRGSLRMSCDDRAARRIVGRALRSDRHWLSRRRPLGRGAPSWAQRMYARSLLALRALTDRRTGAVAAGERDGWAYVWPRDAAAAAIALRSAGYSPESRRIARFLQGLDLASAARFRGDGAAVEGRAAQGDAVGWVEEAVSAAHLPGAPTTRTAWRNRSDYQEGSSGDYLANAIASMPGAGGSLARKRGSGEIRLWFGTSRGLAHEAGDPASGLDSAAAWAVRPFPRPSLFPLVRRTLRHLVATAGRYGITPGEGWPGRDPWTAPTAWTSWSLSTLGARGAALRLLGDLRRAATPTGLLPERVDAHSGIPHSATPLAWSHAFTILALRALWPGGQHTRLSSRR